MKRSGFECTSEFKKISKTDIIIICLPTPLKKNLSPELRYIKDSMKTIKPFLKKGQAISLESTTYPGTSRDFTTLLEEI